MEDEKLRGRIPAGLVLSSSKPARASWAFPRYGLSPPKKIRSPSAGDRPLGMVVTRARAMAAGERRTRSMHGRKQGRVSGNLEPAHGLT